MKNQNDTLETRMNLMASQKKKNHYFEIYEKKWSDKKLAIIQMTTFL